MRSFFALLLAALAFPGLCRAAPSPRNMPIVTTCTGPVATAGQAVARANNLPFGQQPGSCFGRMQTYDGPNFEYVVIGPSAKCPKGRAVDVYARSRAGPWYSYFDKPVCGSSLSIGPKNQWGDWMLTIDGQHYDSRGAFYVPVP